MSGPSVRIWPPPLCTKNMNLNTQSFVFIEETWLIRVFGGVKVTMELVVKIAHTENLKFIDVKYQQHQLRINYGT